MGSGDTGGSGGSTNNEGGRMVSVDYVLGGLVASVFVALIA
jgi:hypothetical protein